MNEDLAITQLIEAFKKCADVKQEYFQLENEMVQLFYCEGMSDETLLFQTFLPELRNQLKMVQQSKSGKPNSNEIINKENRSKNNTLQPTAMNNLNEPVNEKQPPQQNKIHFADLIIPGIKELTKLDDAIDQVFRGNCVIVFQESEQFFIIQTANQPNRQPEDTNLEVPIKGPRDNFIENIVTNIALIRKRLPTNSLAIEKFVVGKRSKTNIAILYFDDIADINILDEIKKELSEIDTDIVISGEILMESLNKKSAIIPRYDYTGRPDYAIQALATGRFILFVEGSSYAMLTPTNFMLFLKSSEDSEYPVLYSSSQRLLRLLGLIVALLLPSFWLALTTFHQNQLPLHLLATVVQSQTGLPLPSALEMILMILFFELFREAGLRLPAVVGGTLSVVGGLIIGDAAIRAGITSPAMVVVIALSTIASFTLVNQSIMATISILRLTYIFITAIFGLFGFFFSLFMTIMVLSHIKIYGVPYINIAADLSWANMKKTLFRVHHESNEKRPEMLKTKDQTRTKKGKKN